jgi:hypothetical protein
MTNKGIPALVAALLVLLPASCTWEDDDNSNVKRVDYGMRGTWECTEAALWRGDAGYSTWEKGRLVLGYDAIIIIGPGSHLPGFTRGIALEAYTEDAEDGKTGLLYIKDRGILQSPVTYRRWQSVGYPGIEMLTLTGGGFPDETFKQVGK